MSEEIIPVLLEFVDVAPDSNLSINITTPGLSWSLGSQFGDTLGLSYNVVPDGLAAPSSCVREWVLNEGLLLIRTSAAAAPLNRFTLSLFVRRSRHADSFLGYCTLNEEALVRVQFGNQRPIRWRDGRISAVLEPVSEAFRHVLLAVRGVRPGNVVNIDLATRKGSGGGDVAWTLGPAFVDTQGLQVTSKTLTPVPTAIKATITPDTKKSVAVSRSSYKSGVVGKIGADNFFLMSGQYEVFEGGHLIPHELWTTTDPQSQYADDYVNLVPMSRTMNVGTNAHTWREQEKKILDYWNTGKSFTIDIALDHPVSHSYTYRLLGQRFGLTVKPGKEDDTIAIYNWIPNKVQATETTNSLLFEAAYENQIFNVHGSIMDGPGLVAVLQQTAIWARCDQALRDELEKL